jgi:hypothetical protein
MLLLATQAEPQMRRFAHPSPWPTRAAPPLPADRCHGGASVARAADNDAFGGFDDQDRPPVQKVHSSALHHMTLISGEAADRLPPGWHEPAALRPRERGSLTSDIRLRLAPRGRSRALPGVINRPPLEGGIKWLQAT